MVSLDELKSMIAGILQIGERMDGMGHEAALLGAVPEFDSMAVVAVLTAIEDNYGVIIDDDEVSAGTFETLGKLLDFVNAKLA